MKKLIISEEEKKSILEQHQILPKDTNEQVMWDKGNLSAIASYGKIGQPDLKYTINVEEPFTLETTDSSEYHKLKHILNKTHTKYTHKEEKI